MATSSQENYKFSAGRATNGAHSTPGILIWADKYKMICHIKHKNKTEFTYKCKYRGNPTYKCKATCQVSQINGKYLVSSSHDSIRHSCEPNESGIAVELLKEKMKEIVRKNPAKAVGKAIFEVRKYAAELYANDEEFYLRIIEELGDDKALTEMLYQVRLKEIGPTPKTRNEFDPNVLFDKNFQEANDILVMDSNDLKEGWKKEISKSKENSKFRWENVNENLRKYEDESKDEGFQEDDESRKDCEMCSREEVHDCSIKEAVNEPTNEKKSIPEESEKSTDLPKRLLAYTSKRLLRLLTKHLKTSMDGTFKSCCRLWSQQFIWMVKIKGMSP